MLQSLHVRGFRCLRDVKVHFTRMHALIGPNDSGKSTLLEAIRLVREGVAGNAMADRLLPAGGRCEAQIDGSVWSLTRDAAGVVSTDIVGADGQSRLGGSNADGDLARNELADAMSYRLVRFDPDELRRGWGLIPDGQAIDIQPRGGGLPAVCDAILNRGDDAWTRLVADVRHKFPAVKALSLVNESQASKRLAATLVDGTVVDAAGLSEGLLYYVAFRALAHVAPRAILLFEEPENGLHPSRIADVVRMIRGLTEGGTQVVIATHSPLVINEMQADEVSIVTRDPLAGTRVTPIARTKNFALRSQAFALGELWLSYADGTAEVELVEPPTTGAS